MRDVYGYDLHTHSSLSDGRNDLLCMLRSAEAFGMKGMVFTDHTFNNQGAEKLLEDYSAANLPASKVRLLYGTETTIADFSGRPAVSPSLLQRFDLVLIDFGGILFQQFADYSDKKSMALQLFDTMMEVCRIPEVTILAHPLNFGLAPLQIPLSLFTDEMLENYADAIRRHGKVFEIMNQMYFWHTSISFEDFHREYSRVIAIMKKAGLRFSLGSDTHSCCGIGNLPWARKIVEEFDLIDDLFLPPQWNKTRMSDKPQECAAMTC